MVIEKVESTICFEYSLSNKLAAEKFDDEQNIHHYIVAKYEIQHCQWIDDKHQCKKKVQQQPHNNHHDKTTNGLDTQY